MSERLNDHVIPHQCSSVGSIQDSTTGGRWLDTQLGQYSFRGLIMVIPLSPLTIVLTMIHMGKQPWPPAYLGLSPLLRHVRKVVGGFGKKLV